jgi:hypothetical protein
MDQALLAFGRGELQQTALYLLIIWLASTVAASWLSERKGYGEKAGLAAGLLLSAVGAFILMIWPARRDSKWKLNGPFGGAGTRTVAEARSSMAGEDAAAARSPGDPSA